jgi:citronellol/citronellal dehydrogenase
MKAENPHILTISPPLTHDAKWFTPHPPYSMAKCTMSLFTLALAAEFAEHGIAVDSLWPRTAIATAAVLYELGGERDDVGGAQARDRGRRRPRDPEPAGPVVNWQIFH